MGALALNVDLNDVKKELHSQIVASVLEPIKALQRDVARLTENRALPRELGRLASALEDTGGRGDGGDGGGGGEGFPAAGNSERPLAEQITLLQRDIGRLTEVLTLSLARPPQAHK
ncbi:hypothetical protein PLESTB_000283500 [Pleodorina starrii]|uniref:Uncharacterized protein n=1 Tax=Pleodorina starrii TaxID=330485 RepID=A0A9W6EZ50_9CHLO|nr:hypothetical protein PLESTB_000283500 [Pleodorina starrii]